MTDCFQCYFLTVCPNFDKGTCEHKALQTSSKPLFEKKAISYSGYHKAVHGDITKLMKDISEYNRTHKDKVFYRAGEFFIQNG